jgi:hypothetical protein
VIRLEALCVAACLSSPVQAAANGGVSKWIHQWTEGAVLSGDGAPLGATALAKDEEVECVSELLTLDLREGAVGVTVEYVLRNDGESKSIEYGFPFAIGEQDRITGDKTTTRSFGKPRGYALAVEGKAVKAEWRRGLELPREVPVPAIEDNEGFDGSERVETRYRWFYFVSPVDLPSGRDVRLKVTYAAPWLVYKKANSEANQWGEKTASPPSFSYLLSTGAGWKGGLIKKLKIVVREAGSALPAAGIEGLAFVQKGKVATYEGIDVRPTREMDLFVRGSDFELINITDEVRPTKAKPWFSPPVGGAKPAILQFGLERLRLWGKQIQYKSVRYRLGLDASRSMAQPARLRVVIGLDNGEQDVFHATFGEAARKAVAASGVRYVYFDEPVQPTSLRLEFLDVHPGPNGDRRLLIDGVTVEKDNTNYTAHVQPPR